MQQERFTDGVRASMPVVLGYLSIGFAAGVVERTAGMSVVEIALICLLLFAGASQFVVAAMLGAGSTATAIVPAVFFMNLRHLLFSTALTPYFRRLSTWQSFLVGAQLTDETFVLASTHLLGKEATSAGWIFGLNLAPYLAWAAANVAGGLFGALIPDAKAFGLDFALPAMFAGLLVLQVMQRPDLIRSALVAVLAAMLAVIFGLVWPGGWGLIAATLLAATAGMVIERWRFARRFS